MNSKPKRAIGRVDPICGRRLTQDNGENCCTEHDGRRTFFCSAVCLAKFLHRVELQRVEALVRAGGLMSRGPASWGLA
jgi:YHS domain-containing protein